MNESIAASMLPYSIATSVLLTLLLFVSVYVVAQRVRREHVWTKEAPIREGFYWYRQQHYPYVVEIVKVRLGQYRLLYSCTYDNAEIPVVDLHGDWRGPLELPK